MIARIIYKPLEQKKSFFLMGPRGTGKTSWLKTNLPESIYIDLLDTEIYMNLLSNPSRLKEYIPPNYKEWIIIDKIQKIPILLNEVHRLIENEGYIFALIGSSARSLRKIGVNLLAGRALTFGMYPFTPQELKDKFSFSKSIKYGLLPSIISESNPKEYLKSYINTYLREEILQEGLTRNLAGFSRFLEVASFSQGQILNKSNIAREIGIKQRTIVNYFDILEDLLISYYLPVFTKKAKRQTIQHPKFYFFDVGVFRSIRPKGILDSESEIEGPALETLFFQIAKALNEYYDLEYQFYYWRTLAGIEVDFILYGPNSFLAFEIKRKNSISKFDLKSLKSFKEDYPESKLFMIYGGNKRLFIDDIEIIPMEDLFKNMLKILKNKS